MKLPHDPKVEYALASTLLNHNGLWSDISSFFRPEMFHNARLRAIVSGVPTLSTITPTTLGDTLLEMDLLEQAGGMDGIAQVFNNGQEPPGAVVRLAETVKDHWLRRQEMGLADKIQQAAQNRAVKANARLDDIKGILAKLEIETLKDGGVYSGKNSLEFAISLFDKRSKNIGQKRMRIPWPVFYPYVPHLPKGTLVGLLGNAGSGKTSFLESISEKWWAQGWRGLYYHLEDSPEVKACRRTARWTGIPFGKLQDNEQDPYLTSEQWQAIMKSTGLMDSWPGDLTLIHCPGWSMAKIIAHINRICDAQQVDYVIIDYLNKVKPDNRNLGLNHTQGRGQDIEDLKSVLEQRGLIGIAGGQFPKDAKGKMGRELWDARDTGELDDKAQVGLIIERSKDEQGEWQSFCKVDIPKCNFGRTGSVSMRMIGPRFLFTDKMDYGEE